jgi:hypothetical protein
MMITKEEKEIVQTLLSAIFQHETLSKPVYCGHIKSEEDAQRLSSELPLVYVWNEDRHRGSFSVSVNDSIVGSILEQKVARNSPAFQRIRDEAIRVLSSASSESVAATCQKLGALPSVLF